MKVLLTLAFIGMTLAHIEAFGQARYALIFLAIMAYFVTRRSIFVTDRVAYNLGGGLVLAGMTIASLWHGNWVSYGYVIFGVLNFLFLPIFGNRAVDDRMLMVFYWLLLLSLFPFTYDAYGRPNTHFENPNNYAGVTFASLYFGMLLYRNNPWMQVVVWAISGVLILLAASRSVVGAYAIFTLLYLGQRFVLRTHLRWSLVVAFFVVAAAYLTMVTDDRYALVATIQESELSEKNARGLSHRDELYAVSLRIQEEYPEGVGLGRSNLYIKERIGRGLSPHNAYLKIWLEGGYLMIVGFLIMALGYLATNRSWLASSFLFALLFRAFFESSAPFTVSLISMMLVLPMFLNERTVRPVAVRFKLSAA